MKIKASVFSGPTNIMAMGHPFISPLHSDSFGVPIGIDVLSKEIVYVDFWTLRIMGVINTKFGILFGDIGYGKSTLLKLMAYRMMCQCAGYSRMHTTINDYKPEKSESEYGVFSRFNNSTVFRMSDMSFNPFESKLFYGEGKKVHELGILDLARDIAEFQKNDRLEGYEYTALRIALSVMLSIAEKDWSPRLLFKLCGSLTVDQIRDYYKGLDGKLKSQYEKRIELLKTDTSSRSNADDVSAYGMTVSDRHSMEYTSVAIGHDNIRENEIQSAGVAVQTYGYDVIEGPFGNMFGTSHSLYDLYTQRVVTKDWRGILPQAETLIRIIDNRVRVSAIENNRTDLLPHIELDDEKHKSMDNLIYARTNAFFSEIARGTHTVSFSASHRPDSIRKGDFQSEQWRLGETILNNQGFVFIGHQQNRKNIIDELRDRYRLGSIADQLPSLPKRTFVMVLGQSEQPRIIRTFVTEIEREMIQTDAATEAINDRPNMANVSQLQAYAEANGIAYIGGDE